jgi:hypothetical protein
VAPSLHKIFITQVGGTAAESIAKESIATNSTEAEIGTAEANNVKA